MRLPIPHPVARRRGIERWHVIAFIVLDGLMAIALVLWLGYALSAEIEIPEVEAMSEASLALALEAAEPPLEPSSLEEVNAILLNALASASRWLAPLPTAAPQDAPQDAPLPSSAVSPATPTATATATPRPKPTPTPRPTTLQPPAQTTAALAGWPKTLNIVLLGSDRRPNSRGWRTDTIIVVAIDPEGKRVGVVSVPRDLWVSLPNYANRVNTFDGVGGPALLKQVLQSQLGIPIHYYARVDFQGFVKAIDTLGGVTVDVECRLVETTPDADAPGGRRVIFDMPAGPVKMDGATALYFSRSRYSTSDFDRMRRQEAVLLAVRKKLLSPEILPRLSEIIPALSAMTQTDIPPKTIIALARLGTEIELKNVRGFLIDERVVHPWTTPSGAAVQVADPARLRAGVQNLWSGMPLTDAIKRPRTMGCVK